MVVWICGGVILRVLGLKCGLMCLCWLIDWTKRLFGVSYLVWGPFFGDLKSSFGWPYCTHCLLWVLIF